MSTITDLRPLHRRAIAVAGTVLAGVTDTDFTNPTPCGSWDLRTLLGHIIGHNHGFAQSVLSPDAPPTAFADRPPQPGGVTAAWRESTDYLIDAFASTPLDRRIRVAVFSDEIQFPVATLVGFHLLDTVVHAWDVARSLDTTFRPDEELLAATLAVAREVPDGPVRERPDGPFAPALAYQGTDDWHRTLALLGRTEATEKAS